MRKWAARTGGFKKKASAARSGRRCLKCGSEKPDRVTEPDAAADFRHEFLDEGKMVAVELVGQVVGVESENMRLMLARDRVRSGDVENAVAGRRRFERRGFVLPTGEDAFGPDAQTAVAKIESGAQARGRNARQIEFRVDEFGAHRGRIC